MEEAEEEDGVDCTYIEKWEMEKGRAGGRVREGGVETQNEGGRESERETERGRGEAALCVYVSVNGVGMGGHKEEGKEVGSRPSFQAKQQRKEALGWSSSSSNNSSSSSNNSSSSSSSSGSNDDKNNKESSH